MARTPHAKSARRLRVQQARSKGARERTPDEVDGINGFMFTSPQRVSKKGLTVSPPPVTSPKKDRTARRLFDASLPPHAPEMMPKVAAAKAHHQTAVKSAAGKTVSPRAAKVEETLFSPYKCTQKHSYNTRFMASLRHQIAEHDNYAAHRNPASHPVMEQISEITTTVAGPPRIQLVVDQAQGVLAQYMVHQEESKTIRSRRTDMHHRFVLTPEDIDAYEHGELDLDDLSTDEAIDSFLLIDRLMNKPEFYCENHMPVLPPPTDNRTTLVLDLDETLVHCSTEAAKLPRPDLNFTVNFQNRDFDVFVQLRPFLREFLELASTIFELVIFTASQKIYADKLLDLLDPGRKFTKYRLFRDSCIQVEGTFVKDLRVLGRDLSRVIIVDNAVEAFSFQIPNGVPIKSWFAEEEDRELIKILRLLTDMEHMADVRPFLRNRFRVEEQIANARRHLL